ncbi:MAG TPA: copper transporter [Solirubrobacteraceae bacterium]|nr:copper transporter [Solirubrobacteraceae bacterium]
MFDFRYHALSLAAVFIALIVGLLLGVAIGDKELVSSGREELRSSLRADVRQADQERDEARAEAREQKQFAEEAYPILTDDQLRGRRIGLVVLGDDDRAADLIRRTLEPTGADLAFVAVVRENFELEALAQRARGTRYANVADDPELLGEFGRRVGIQMVRGGRLVRQVRTALLDPLSGSFGNVDGVIVMRPADGPEEQAAAKRLEELHDGIVRGLVQTDVKVVGVERRRTDPSHIDWFREHEMSTVDNVDEYAGRAATVFVLAGAQGAYGRGDDAQALLPPVVGQVE